MKKAIIHQHYPLDYAGEEALNSICTNLAFIGTDKRIHSLSEVLLPPEV